jgi:hypothetical protein
MSRLLTEEEAKQVVCPLTSIIYSSFRSVGGPTCFATGCMMWRWEKNREPGHPRRGYCGMAGDPES